MTHTPSRARFATVLLAVLSLLAVPLHAQQYTLSNTTLSGAIDNAQTSLVLASASASSGSTFGAPAAGQCLFMDNELMTILSMSSTTATVRRAVVGATSHANAAVIFTATCNAFKAVDPPARGGNNTCSAQPAPWINVSNGNVWWCNRAANTWSGTNFVKFTYNSVPIAQ